MVAPSDKRDSSKWFDFHGNHRHKTEDCIDGSSNFKGSGLGIVLTSLDGDTLERSISNGFKVMNNEAEYEAMIAGLNLDKEIGMQRLTVCSDSQLVINQMQGHYQARDNKMTAYLDIVNKLTTSFQECIAR